MLGPLVVVRACLSCRFGCALVIRLDVRRFWSPSLLDVPPQDLGGGGTVMMILYSTSVRSRYRALAISFALMFRYWYVAVIGIAKGRGTMLGRMQPQVSLATRHRVKCCYCKCEMFGSVKPTRGCGSVPVESVVVSAYNYYRFNERLVRRHTLFSRNYT